MRLAFASFQSLFNLCSELAHFFDGRHCRCLHLFLELVKQQLFWPTVGDVKELGVEVRQLNRALISLVSKGVAFEVVSPLAQDTAGLYVMFHHRFHAVLLDRADLHANSASIVVCHHWSAALIDHLVFLNASVPDFVSDQRPPGTAIDADLALLTEVGNPEIHRLIVYFPLSTSYAAD